MTRPASTCSTLAVIAALTLPLAACGPSAFSREVTPVCISQGNTPEECDCMIPIVEEGLPDRVKPAFVSLRWPLRPPERDQERVYNDAMRAAGVDPADRQAVESIRLEFDDAYAPLRDTMSDQCDAVL
ncbi:MAG: hypothetical protein IT546_14795 [Caulobacteraceae bacterium]|jgi:hypothetical protein|nr:hypothetical protein [Caulobacteraceae bacterium]